MRTHFIKGDRELTVVISYLQLGVFWLPNMRVLSRAVALFAVASAANLRGDLQTTLNALNEAHQLKTMAVETLENSLQVLELSHEKFDSDGGETSEGQSSLRGGNVERTSPADLEGTSEGQSSLRGGAAAPIVGEVTAVERRRLDEEETLRRLDEDGTLRRLRGTPN